MSRQLDISSIKMFRRLAAASLLIWTQNAWSIMVSPAPSLNGYYTVSWPISVRTGCTYYQPDPWYIYYECYWLEERIGNGNWVSVSTPNYSTSWNASGKPPGTHQYRIQYAYGDYWSGGQYVVDGPVSVQVGPAPLPLPLAEQQEYATRHGDLDNDGDIDIYVKRVAGTSWQLPVQQLILRRNSNGTYGVETTISAADMNKINQWDISLTFPKLVDFNADGFLDILITGLGMAGVGPYDVVVFASNMPGAPTPSARLMDGSIRQFAMDLLAYSNDANYFAGAFQVVCSWYWTTVPGGQWDIDGDFTYIGIPVPITTCGFQVNPNFSPAAVAVSGSVSAVSQAGEIAAGSNSAITIAQQFAQLFGTPYMGGALQSGGNLLPIDVVEELENVEYRVRRAARVLNGIYQIYLWAEETQVQAGPHSYSVTTTICPVTWSACTLDHVFFKMRQLPTFGHSAACGNVSRSQCAIPVQNGDVMLVETLEWPGNDDDVGPILHLVFPGTYTLQNITLEGHLFHEGQITRRAYIENGEIKIVTTGTGNGPYPAMNEVVGPGVFKLIDIEIRNRIESEQLRGIAYP